MRAPGTPWRLLVTLDREPAWNMALDEALLLAPDSPPTVRFYTWKPPAVSLGWFQAAREVEPLPPGAALVRRITGGLAIYHYREFTWSIVAGESFFPGPIEGSYRSLHAALIAAMHELGARGIRLREKDALLSDGAAGTPWCFAHSSPLDLVANQRKLAGSAQRRTGGKILHHGSLPLQKNPLTPRSTWVSRLTSHTVDMETMGKAFAAALSRELEVDLVRGKLTPGEESRARELMESKHASPAHVHRQVRGQGRRGCGLD